MYNRRLAFKIIYVVTSYLQVTGMEVRIGVLQHSLLQARMKDRSAMQRDFNTAMQDKQIFQSAY